LAIIGNSIFLNNSALGPSLNFNIVGGSSQPSNPTPNMIWVETDTTINGYSFSIEEPTNPSNGSIWVATGTNTLHSFSVIKNNSIIVYPSSVLQYINNSWEVKTAYIYQNSRWDLFSGSVLPQINCTGVEGIDYVYAEDEETSHFEMAILNSCDISFQFSVAIDVFLVGGGASGETGYSNASGGDGGNGGETILLRGFKPVTSQIYPMIIGSSDNATTGFDKIARSGYGSVGGIGGDCYGNNHDNYPSAGSPGVVAFNGSNETGLSLLPSSYRNILYGAGGGGADCVNSLYVWSTGAGSNDGGLTGGGEGGFDPNGGQDAIGKPGLPNTGGGGGGGCGNGAIPRYFSGGAGGSGIILIRDAR
jgi:hypothetical protein